MDKKTHKPDISPAPVEEAPFCVVCGGREGDLSETAGKARWHKACEQSHPHVIAKVKARA